MSMHKELEALINKYGREHPINTPAFILADYLMTCLSTCESTVMRCDDWRERDKKEES